MKSLLIIITTVCLFQFYNSIKIKTSEPEIFILPGPLPLQAIAFFNTSEIAGEVLFTQETPKSLTHIQMNIKGPSNTTHGIHVHQFGDLSNGCESTGEHYNPFNMPHGGPNSELRHVGDMGNIKCDDNGNCQKEYYDRLIKLLGPFSVVGRAVVIHAGRDNELSQPSGNSGTKIACAVIGWKNTK